MKSYFTFLLTSALLIIIGIGLVSGIQNQKALAATSNGMKIPFTAGILVQDPTKEEIEEDKEFSELYLESIISFNQLMTLEPKEEEKLVEPSFALGLDLIITDFLLTEVKEEEELVNEQILENEKRLAEEAAAKQKAEEEAIIKAKLEAEAQAKAKAEKEAKEKAEREAKEKAEREAKAKAEAQRKAQEQAQAQQANTQQTEKAQPTNSTESGGAWMNFEATAYTPYCTGCSGITANGHNLRKSLYKDGKLVVAVDRRKIPMGTTLEVKLKNGKTFLATAQDTGGAIKGNKIDIAYATKNEAYSFGRQTVQVRIVK